MSRSPRRLTWAVVGAMVLGILLGSVLGPTAAPLGVAGKIVIKIIKVGAIPLVFLTIIDAIVTTSLSWRSARPFFRVIFTNTSCALLIGLILSNVLQPGTRSHLPIPQGSSVPSTGVGDFTFAKAISSFVPESILHPFFENNVLGVVVLALFVGSAVRKRVAAPDATVSAEAVGRVTTFLSGTCETILEWVVCLVPLGVLGVTASTIGEHGVAPLLGLAWYVGLALAGLTLQVLVVYSLWIFFVAKVPVRRFLFEARAVVVHAFGTNSSLATLPLTLRALDDLGVARSASRLGACVGTNLNNDGILLYEVFAVLFVAQVYGIDLSLGQQLLAAAISVGAAVGVAGVPEAGVISLSLVLGAVGLPVEILPLLLTVDWLVARVRSVVNVLSDMTISIAINALQQES